MAAASEGKGRFAKGNKTAKGGKRANAGRPEDVVKKAAKQIAEGRVEQALAVIDKCLDMTPPELPDVSSLPAETARIVIECLLANEPSWKDRIKASELMLAYAWHKPTQPMQHGGALAWQKVYGPNMPTEQLLPPAE